MSINRVTNKNTYSVSHEQQYCLNVANTAYKQNFFKSVACRQVNKRHPQCKREVVLVLPVLAICDVHWYTVWRKY